MSRTLTAVVLFLLVAVVGGLVWRAGAAAPAPIRIGILHSIDPSTTMAISERPIVDAYVLAIEEINRRGGVLGRPLVAVLRDGRSDPVVFRKEATALIDEDKVCTIFGCWTSASH